MKWQDRARSAHVEDRRGTSVARKGAIGGGAGILVLALVFMLLGGDPSTVLNLAPASQATVASDYVPTEEENELADFASVVLAETETVWTDLLGREGIEYAYPNLVLYTGAVETGFGTADASTGPFYAPSDGKVYIDLSFFQELKSKYGASGDFAMAYVIAHEVGHHVQNLTGINDQVNNLRTKLSEKDYNEILVRMELQADYYAGVWAHYASRMNLLESGDLEEALGAASAVGDDRLQQQAYGYTMPDSFTHGTSAQRSAWFLKGFEKGTVEDGDTFNLDDP